MIDALSWYGLARQQWAGPGLEKKMELPRLERIPSVATVMTPFPYAVSSDDPITVAERLMQQHGISHVPVQDDGRLVGIITERDISLLVDSSLPTSSRELIPVRRICSQDPYLVDIHESLGVVVRELATRHEGAAVVTRDERLAGIFTMSDACRVLAKILGESDSESEPDEVA